MQIEGKNAIREAIKSKLTINKIMVFYSDNTFDTFVLEKEKKE